MITFSLCCLTFALGMGVSELLRALGWTKPIFVKKPATYVAPEFYVDQQWIFRRRIRRVIGVYPVLNGVLLDGGESVDFVVLRNEGKLYTDEAWEDLLQLQAAMDEVSAACKQRSQKIA
jgi:hypothetical protein